MKDPTTLHYFCRFDPNTGERLASYIKEYQDVPVDTVRVSYEDYKKYLSDPLWRYDFNIHGPVYAKPVNTLSYKEAMDKCDELINSFISKKIKEGFTAPTKAGYVKFDSDLTDQLNYSALYTASTLNPGEVWYVRGVLPGNGIPTEIELTSEEVQQVYKACTEHIAACRKRGYGLKSYVHNTSRAVEDLRSFIISAEINNGDIVHDY